MKMNRKLSSSKLYLSISCFKRMKSIILLLLALLQPSYSFTFYSARCMHMTQPKSYDQHSSIKLTSVAEKKVPIAGDEVIISDRQVVKSSSILFSSAIIFSLIFPSPSLAVDASATILFARPVLDIFINSLSVFFLCRIIISWYPKTDLKKFPYTAILWPTEPLLAPVRDLIPPAFGVDVSPIVWIMLLSFLREILTGQQGILTLLEKS